MRTAPSRVRRLLALLLLALSVGWLLLRRRVGASPPRPVLRPVPDLPPEPETLATDAGLTAEPGAPAPEPVAEPVDEVPADVLATDAGLTDAPPADTPHADADPVGAGPVEAGPPTDVIPAVDRKLDPEATTVLPRFVDPDEPAPTGTDDLRKIRGIGPAIERTLHELGITTYQQIVELEGPSLERVRKRLEAFSARIEREDWRGQARDLHRLKYGEQR